MNEDLRIFNQYLGMKDIIIQIPNNFEKELILITNDSDMNITITIPPKGKLILRKEETLQVE